MHRIVATRLQGSEISLANSRPGYGQWFEFLVFSGNQHRYDVFKPLQCIADKLEKHGFTVGRKQVFIDIPQYQQHRIQLFDFEFAGFSLADVECANPEDLAFRHIINILFKSGAADVDFMHHFPLFRMREHINDIRQPCQNRMRYALLKQTRKSPFRCRIEIS
ncbi:hypothetical protein GALL_529750 [mine drainage metagenome]|uniref:Uncharacterized protein n=1 Tax=mine drainage metagenome TaxID=410659 RepID=A0A1J5P441_9ZZZZ